MITRRSLLLGLGASAAACRRPAAREAPNIILCMADDQGWGDMGYQGHPVLKTPVFDEMAATGLRFDRFYAAAPVCSPTRGSVLTGRHPNRYGCWSWGRTLRPQEITVAQALKHAGYTTGHFGKWHVGSVRADSPVSPGACGFDEWVSSPNFYENDPLMSHNGKVIKTRGEGSQVTVDFAIEFIRAAAARKQRFLALVWFGSPHAPHEAIEEDLRLYQDQPEKLAHFYGEITAMDRAVGNLRRELRRLGIAENTLFWYKSDNGALPIGSAGHLSGRKGDLLEGGLRVPGILEWPARIPKPRITQVPCNTSDIYPTLVDLAGVNVPNQVEPLDGVSLVPLFDGRMEEREAPMGFWAYPGGGIGMSSPKILAELASEQAGEIPPSPPPPDPGEIRHRYSEEEDLVGWSAWMDGDYKLHRNAPKEGAVTYTLNDLAEDPQEKADILDREPERVARMKDELERWQKSVIRSVNGEDYR